jgi:hypothetical protein
LNGSALGAGVDWIIQNIPSVPGALRLIKMIIRRFQTELSAICRKFYLFFLLLHVVSIFIRVFAIGQSRDHIYAKV